MKFLPTTREEMKQLGWDRLDVLLISGDTYLDTSYNGSALVGKWLVKHGFRVGIIAQPEVDSPKDITRLGEPDLFFAISGGCVDSMVANYTATKKRRQQDDFTPGGLNDRRPDRAVLVYSNMIRRFFKGTQKKIVISGIESSLRRITHYDYWSNKLRKPILFDAKALWYGRDVNACFGKSLTTWKRLERYPRTFLYIQRTEGRLFEFAESCGMFGK